MDLETLRSIVENEIENYFYPSSGTVGTPWTVVFDPVENEFMLAVRHNDKLSTIGVRGDAVGCFMAR